MPLIFTYWTLAICVVFLFFMLLQRRYRLLIPSTLHTITWGITALIMIFQMKRIYVSSNFGENAFSSSAGYMFGIVVASVVGFSLAHIITQNQKTYQNQIDTIAINNILTKYKWIPYLCAVTGILLLAFIITSIGSIEDFSDYRSKALSVERTGIFAIVKRLSGHINILGSFYLMLLGYKMGKEGINIKVLLLTIILCSLINMSIGGRVWILSSTLPFFVIFFLSRQGSILDKSTLRSDYKKIIFIAILFICLFSIIGVLRSDPNKQYQPLDKYQYFSDGMRITNMALKQYPPGCYDLEYGRSEFLALWIGSPMSTRFNESLSHDIGLSVTVKSSLPYLYYDFGFWGGIIMWGIFCFILEYICLKLKYTKTIIGILLFGQLSQLLFQSPIFPVFSMNVPPLEWILILYIFRKYLFGKIPNCKQYI